MLIYILYIIKSNIIIYDGKRYINQLIDWRVEGKLINTPTTTTIVYHQNPELYN